jgi:hypothetical protein
MNATCPQCGTDHLHAAVDIDADLGDRYEVHGTRRGGRHRDRPRESGRALVATGGSLSVLRACDWTGDRFIRWESGSPPETRGGE